MLIMDNKHTIILNKRPGLAPIIYHGYFMVSSHGLPMNRYFLILVVKNSQTVKVLSKTIQRKSTNQLYASTTIMN